MTSLSPALRRTLAVDALTCAGAGALMAFAAAPLAPLTGLPQPLLLWAGIALLPVAVVMAVLARRQAAPAALVWLVVLGNAGWVLGSLAVLVLAGPSLIGELFVIAQAAAVAVLTVLEYRALVAADRLQAA